MRSGAIGAGRTWSPPKRRRWSAGRRRTPTSLGCARPRKARGGPSQGSPGCGSQRTRRLPALHLPCVQGRRKRGKGRRPAPENRSVRAAKRCCVRTTGKEDDRENELKPFVAVQRVRLPRGKGQPASRKQALHVCGNVTREAYGSRCRSCVLAPKSAIAEAFAVNAAGAAST